MARALGRPSRERPSVWLQPRSRKAPLHVAAYHEQRHACVKELVARHGAEHLMAWGSRPSSSPKAAPTPTDSHALPALDLVRCCKDTTRGDLPLRSPTNSAHTLPQCRLSHASHLESFLSRKTAMSMRFCMKLDSVLASVTPSRINNAQRGATAGLQAVQLAETSREREQVCQAAGKGLHSATP